MATQKTNTIGLKVGDVISFTNKVGSFKELEVTRVEEKSWYVGNSRNSYGTLDSFRVFPDFKITRN